MREQSIFISESYNLFCTESGSEFRHAVGKFGFHLDRANLLTCFDFGLAGSHSNSLPYLCGFAQFV